MTVSKDTIGVGTQVLEDDGGSVVSADCVDDDCEMLVRLQHIIKSILSSGNPESSTRAYGKGCRRLRDNNGGNYDSGSDGF